MPGGGQRLGGDYGRPAEADPISVTCADNPVILGGGLCALLTCIVGTIMSLGAVPPLHLGIAYNQFTKVANMDKVYQPGRFFIGPFNNFILFPSDVQHIEFTNNNRIKQSGLRYAPLHTRTKEGLGLHLQVSLQYRLIIKDVTKLYSEFNNNYEQVFVSSVRDVLIKAASEYDAVQLWQERELFSAKMQRMVDKELRRTYAECWGLQLMVIDLPNSFEKSIVQTQVQNQEMLLQEQQQISTKIRAETTVIKAQFERQAKVIMANGHANYTIITKEAAARAQQSRIVAESEALTLVKQKLKLDPDGLATYLQYGAIEDLGQASIVFGLEQGQAMLTAMGGGHPES